MRPSLSSLLFLLPENLVLVRPPPGGKMVDYRDGVMASVAVIEDAAGGRLLKVNDRFQMGGTTRSFADRRQAHIPLLLHPNPRSVLFLGLGTGITAGAAAHHPGLAQRGVELVPEVVDVLDWFSPTNNIELIVDGAWIVADARRYVRATDETFDVIIADLFHPARDGAGALYTSEHFEAISRLLNPGGVFCQWLPLYQLDLEMVRVITRTFLHVFPGARAYIAHFNVDTPMIGLVAAPDGLEYDAAWYERRVTDPGLVRALEEVALGTGLTLFGTLLAGPDDLEAFAGEGPLNTDDRPIVVFEAPRFTYRKDEPKWGRTPALLDAFNPAADDLLGPAPDDDPDLAFRVKLDNYLRARDLYLRSHILFNEGHQNEGLAALLQSAAASTDFKTAYVMALQLAIERHPTDRALSRDVLRSLVDIAPDDPRAAKYLKELFGE